MKTAILCGKRQLGALFILLILCEAVQAQLPDCINGNMMYAVFNNVAGSTTADSTEIRPVNVNTGAIGNLVGGRRYWIRKRLNSSNPYYYGTAALGVDMITNRFYVMTQMSIAMPKDVITIEPVTGAMTVIGTTPTSSPNLNNYHFVKLAISPNGYGYAIGVHRDSSQAAATCNPLIRFTTCGAVPSAGCSTIELLGYLPSTGDMYKWKLFNGDIAFDVLGNMYFATAAFDPIGGILRYADARLFRINAADIPNTAGTGTIPMTFVADYDGLDSTVINGIGLDDVGSMYLTTRRFTGVQTSPPGPSNSELYRSSTPGGSVQITPFAPITTNFSVADLGSCYYPAIILADQKLQLNYKYENGKVNLKWNGRGAADVAYYEVQRSDNGADFTTIGTVMPSAERSASYTFSDPQSGFDRNKYYRIRQIARTNDGWRYYSNVVHVSFNSNISITASSRPNPFVNRVDANIWLRANTPVQVRMIDQSGRAVYTQRVSGRSGDNKISISNIGHLTAGVYIVEFAVESEVIREKLIKQ